MLTMLLVYRFEEYLPPSVREWIHDKYYSFRRVLVANGILADNSDPSSGPVVGESKAVTEARDAWNAIKNDMSNTENEVRQKKEDLSKDYGPHGVFRALKGNCISIDSGEYTYELCWMDKVNQKSKKSHANTGLGDFARFDRVHVDEDVGADGKGLGRGERLALVYENGQQCWNGPRRSTQVVLACREKDEIWKVVEVEKCLYRIEAGTPAVCEEDEVEEGKVLAKDEL
jgi:protein kinase C substrate 80K-H